MSHPDEINPYQPPQAPIAEPPPPARRFRLRVIPAAFCGLFGAFCLVASAIGLAGLPALVEKFGWSRVLAHPLIPGVVAYGLGGAVLAASAWPWMRGRWWLAVLLTLISIGALRWANLRFRSQHPQSGQVGLLRPAPPTVVGILSQQTSELA
jgi:hypothetical protein